MQDSQPVLIADARKLSVQERCELRQRLAVPIFDSFEKWMEQTYGKVPLRSRMGQAVTYAYPLWPKMRNYLFSPVTCKARNVNPREWPNNVIAILPYYLAKGSGRNVCELLTMSGSWRNPTCIQLEF